MFTGDVIASFNELETSLYDYISKNSEKVVYMRIRDLADETHVSTSTILRFCRKLKCEGFSEFKVKLKLYLDENEKVNIKSSQYVMSEFVERTKNGHFEAALLDAASLIVQSDNLIFIGSGSSGILAEYGARYFSSLGKFSMYVKDPYIPIHANYLQNSTTIALSVSGENRFTVSHLNELKQKGSNIISITNNKHCTIANMADINISYYVTEEWYKKSNITTQIPVVYILEETARKMQKLTEQSE